MKYKVGSTTYSSADSNDVAQHGLKHAKIVKNLTHHEKDKGAGPNHASPLLVGTYSNKA